MDTKELHDSKSPYPTKIIAVKDKPIDKSTFPFVEINTLLDEGENSCGFGLQVFINGKEVKAPQKCVIEAGNEDFTMVTLTFPAIIKR